MNPNLAFGSTPIHVTGDYQVKAGKGILRNVVLNGLTTVGDLTIYDSLTEAGTVIAVLHIDVATSLSVQPINFPYNAKFATGCYAGFDGGLAADFTFMID